ncbi:class I SAM-dependent methyltransferase [Halorarum salinum]|uniref:Class I SAM-dependent methyltransferase n=1 Tax=Halorarum salinum TaxID=2743089 RepID=A0A7D5QB45_9EURY|nr:class I SAM-dependent methyltransferase [Halobaculum salinum]QLG62278.1 class I SAM-dependent methyltransferase [Halobaculum salinum]
MTTRELRQTPEAWNEIAAGYDEFVTPTHAHVSEAALNVADLRPGTRFLDVAAGTGSLSLPAARLGAEVVATDISPAMVEHLATHAKEEGLSNVEARVMDGHALELEDDAFDVSGSQYGVMLFSDLPRALGEMVRVTKPGGRVLVVVYGNPEEMEFLGFFTRAVRSVIPDFEGLPRDPTPLPFQVADPAKLRQRLEEAGLEDVRVETVAEELEFGSGRQLWDWLMNSNPIPGTLVADTTEEQRAAAREVLDELVRERAEETGVAVLTSPVHVGIGTK